LVALLAPGGCGKGGAPAPPVTSSSAADATVSAGGHAPATTGGHAPTDAASAARAVRPTPAAAAWARWPMPNVRLPGLPNPQSYDTAIPNLVTDRITGLMWQRNVPNKFLTFQDAQRKCAGLSLGGYTDWRLPSRIELVSLIDTTHIQPSIDGVAFPSTPIDWFWTSSRAADDPNAAWYVYFYFGYPKTDEIGSQFSVRCVREARPRPSPPTRYETSPKEILDVATGLRWQRAASPKALSFVAAASYCGHLNLAGKPHWRVPTMGELLTLIDERADSPMIDRAAFPETPGEPFWSSSTFANGHELAWYVRFDRGSGLYGRLIEPFRVRCVR
jgi:Protein of unknown function (DUF1566)